MLNFGIRYQDSDRTDLTESELAALPYATLITTSLSDLSTNPDSRLDLAEVLSAPGTQVRDIYGYVSLTGVFALSDPFASIPVEDRYLHIGSAPGTLEVWRADYWSANVQSALSAEFARVLAAGATAIFLDEVDIYFPLGETGSRLNTELGGSEAPNPLVNSALVTMNSVIALADANPGVEIMANVDPFMLTGVLRNVSIGGSGHEATIDAFADRVKGVLIENFLNREASLSPQGAADMLTGMRAWAAEGITVYVSADFDMSGTLTTGPFVFSTERVLDFYARMAREGFVPTANAFDARTQGFSLYDRFDSNLPVFNLATPGDDVLALYGAEDGTLAGGDGDDLLIGRDGADLLEAGMGEDTVYGGLDRDLIRGDDGDDSLDGERSSDTIYGGSGDDTIDGGSSADEVHGEAGSDSILGGSSGDLIFGGTQKDTIRGGTSADTIYGGSHEDRLYGDSSDDRLYGDGSADTIYGGTGDDLIYGGGSADKLYGGSNRDMIFGGSNNDTLYGGASSDTLTGGTGRDVFVFSTGIGTSIDTITDFSVVDDTIRLEDSVFVGLGAGALAASAFAANTTGLATSAAHRILYETDSGAVFFDADGSGAGARVQFALLAPGLALTAGDFIIV